MKLTKKIINRIRKTKVIQQDSSDCGIACLSSILKFYSINNSIEELRNTSGTTQQGTNFLGLQKTTKQYGLECEGYIGDIESLKILNKFAILHTNLESNLQHFILVYGYDKSKGFLILDPAKGVNYVDENYILSIWKSKACLVFEDTNINVRNIENEFKTILKWLKINIYPDKHFLVFAIFLGILTSILSVAMSIFSQKVIDEILPSKNYNKLFWSIALLFIVLNLKSFFSLFQQYLLAIQSKTLNNRLNKSYFKNMLFLPISFFESRKTGDIITRLNDSEKITSFVKILISSFFNEIFTIIVSIYVIFYYSTEIGYISLILIPLLFFCIYFFNKKISELQYLSIVNNSLRESNYISTIKNIVEIILNNKQNNFSEKNRKINETYLKSNLNLNFLNIKIQSYVSVISSFSIIIIISLACFFIVENKLELGKLIALIGVSSTILLSTINIALVIIPINETKIILKRIIEFEKINKEINTENEQIFDVNIESIEMKNISFGYPGSKYLLENISLKIEKGNIIGLLGNSGNGKTTLSKILLGFYKTNEGEIVINNEKSIHQLNIFEYRNKIGYLSQEIEIFNESFLYNITLDENINQDKINEIFSYPIFANFLRKFNNGFYTILGENGVNLSGGQKQLLSFCRILYKNPDFIILDEPTSSLDKNIESDFSELIIKLKHKHLIIFVSHDENLLKQITSNVFILKDRNIVKYLK